MEHSLKHPTDFNLADLAFVRNPVPQLEAMRDAGPVIPMRLPVIGNIWVTTTYAATEEVMKGKDRFFIEKRNAGGRGGAAIPWWFPPNMRIMAENMLGKDDPDHRRLRKLVDIAFRRNNALDLREDVEDIAFAFLGKLKDGDDLVETFSRQLPLRVISDLLGLIGDEQAAFEKAARPLTNMASPREMIRLIFTMRKLVKVVRQLIENARTAPRPGLLTDLIDAEQDGDRLSENELISMVFLLLFAGMETTTNLISGSVVALQNWPDELDWLLDDFEGRRESAVEELTRYVSAVTGTKPRFVAEDTVVAGQALRQREKIMALPISANFDPSVFEDPEDLILDRFPNPHLSFSSGTHFCLGMQLARVEVQAALQALYEYYPTIRVGDPDYLRRPGHRAIRTLPILSR